MNPSKNGSPFILASHFLSNLSSFLHFDWLKEPPDRIKSEKHPRVPANMPPAVLQAQPGVAFAGGFQGAYRRIAGRANYIPSPRQSEYKSDGPDLVRFSFGFY